MQKEIESFDSFFAGLSMKEEKNASKLYKKYIDKMKRTGFDTTKPRKPLRRTELSRGTTQLRKTPLRKVSPTKVKKKKPKISILKKKLWKIFSQYIRERDKYICFTCGRHATGSGMHSGHFISKSVGGISLYFHEDNVHAQCYNCNINLSGNQWEYGQRLGEEKVVKLMEIKKIITKWSVEDYEEKIAHYQSLI